MPQGTQERGEDQLTALFPPGTGVSPGAMSPRRKKLRRGFSTWFRISRRRGRAPYRGPALWASKWMAWVRRGESSPSGGQALGEADRSFRAMVSIFPAPRGGSGRSHPAG